MATQVERVKWCPGTRVMVDGFAFPSPRCRTAILTHFHSDHTVGLTRGSWPHSTIWCSRITAALLADEFRLFPPTVRVLELGAATEIEPGVVATAIDANHCPGAIMVLFEIRRSVAAAAIAEGDEEEEEEDDEVEQQQQQQQAAAAAAGGGGTQQQLLQQRRRRRRRRRHAGVDLPPPPPGEADDGVAYVLHTGDCRWHDGLRAGSVLARVPRIDVLMLDATFAAPRWRFPPQAEAIRIMAAAMRRELQRGREEEAAATAAAAAAAEAGGSASGSSGSRSGSAGGGGGGTLLAVASYHIGKERAVFGGALLAGGLRVYAPPAKRRTLELLELPKEHLALLTADPRAAQVHIVPMGLDHARLAAAYILGGDHHAANDAGGDASCSGDQTRQQQQQQQPPPAAAAPRYYSRVVAFRPTGWAHRKAGGLSEWTEGPVTVFGVPYSEHSSWDELRACVRALRPRVIVPTVNAATPAEEAAVVERFVDLMDLTGRRDRIDAFVTRRPRQEQQQRQKEQQQQRQHEQQRQELEEGGSGGGEEGSGSGEGEGAAAAASAQTTAAEREAARSGGAAELVPLLLPPGVAADGVDLEQQRRLLQEAERLQRLRRSVASKRAAAAAAAAGGTPSGGGKRKRTSGGSRAS